MKNKKIIQTSVGIIAGAAMLASGAGLVFAQTSTTQNSGTSTTKSSILKQEASNAKFKLNQSKDVKKANDAIDKRIQDLNSLSSRISEMKNVTSTEQSTLSNSIQAEITNLNNLKTKIAADSDMASLNSDVKSITSDTRIYALVIPQDRILAASDKATTVINMLNAMGSKLQTRISDAQTAGKDVTALNTALADFNAKLAEATSLSGSIASGISTLTSDQGNKTVLASNNMALKTARQNLSKIESDLNAARKDVKTIMGKVKGIGESATATSTHTEETPAGTSTTNQ